MPLSADQQFQKATFLLDRGELGRGELLLREVVATADSSGQEYLAVRARCCLGELLTELGRLVEAETLLRAVADHKPSTNLDDLMDPEQQRARELLQQFGNGA